MAYLVVLILFFGFFFCLDFGCLLCLENVLLQLSGVMLPETEEHQHSHAHKASHSGQDLADPEIAPVQAVGPQTLDEGAAQAVPGQVHEGHLAVILAPLGEEVQQNKAHGIPQGLVEEGGVVVVHGTARVGKYLQVKDYDGKADPLVSVIADFEPVDVDNAADLQAEMNRLGEFWSQHFVLQDRETPVDNVNGQEAVISWQENYYLSGLPSNVLNMNPWLEQSKGWLDYYESEGTLDARK